MRQQSLFDQERRDREPQRAHARSPGPGPLEIDGGTGASLRAVAECCP